MSVQMMMGHYALMDGVWTLRAVLYVFAMMGSSLLIILMSVKVNTHIYWQPSHFPIVQHKHTHTYKIQIGMSVLTAVKMCVPMENA